MTIQVPFPSESSFVILVSSFPLCETFHKLRLRPPAPKTYCCPAQSHCIFAMAVTTTELEHPDTLTRAQTGLQKADQGSDILGEKLVLNMGPSHPATHGVLRLVLELDGEIITKATPDIGYLHRGDEKIAENMLYNQFVPYTDRLDYLAPIANNVAYALAVEKLMGWTLPPPRPEPFA